MTDEPSLICPAVGAGIVRLNESVGPKFAFSMWHSDPVSGKRYGPITVPEPIPVLDETLA